MIIWLLLCGHLTLIYSSARLYSNLHDHVDVKCTGVLASGVSDATTGTHCRFKVSTNTALTERSLPHLHPEHQDNHKSSLCRCLPMHERVAFMAEAG